MLLPHLLKNILDVLLPQRAEVRRIEAMTPALFVATAKREWRKEIFPNISARFAYEEPVVRRAVHELKYRGNENIAKLLGALLYEALLAETAEDALFRKSQKILLIPIPLSLTRERKRGFNQTKLLAQAISRCDNGECFEYTPNVLVKIRETTSQTQTKNKKERLKNLAGAFSVPNSDRVNARRIVLIDDVVTTGATMREAIKTLRASGATEVRGIAVAH